VASKNPYLFISYRNEDTGMVADRLYADLARELAAGQVFLDHERIKGGDEWPAVIRDELRRATAMFVLIESRWLTAQDPLTGDRRLNQAEDWIRREVETALGQVHNVVPVLVDDALPLTKRALETVPSIMALADRQAMKLRRKEWEADVRRLMGWLVDHSFSLRDLPTAGGTKGSSELTVRLTLDRVTPLRELEGGRSLLYGTVPLSDDGVAYGKGLTLQVTAENLSDTAVVVHTLDLVVEDRDEHPLEDCNYQVLRTSGTHLEMPASSASMIEITELESLGDRVPMNKGRLFLQSRGTQESQHSVTVTIVARAPGLWRLGVDATFADADGALAPSRISTTQFSIVQN
jgi:hypothetical protein